MYNILSAYNALCTLHKAQLDIMLPTMIYPFKFKRLPPIERDMKDKIHNIHYTKKKYST